MLWGCDMCGIWGIVTDKTSRVDVPTYTTLGEMNLTRGSRGHGAWLWNDDATLMFHHQDTFKAWMYTPEFYRVALAHNLAPTGESGHPHPFEIDGLILAHNGILVDWEALKPWRPASLSFDVDTTVILAGIWFHRTMGMGTSEAILRTLAQVRGQQACWLFDAKEKAVYIWRVMSTLWLGETASTIHFSSAKAYMATNEVPEGSLFRIDVDCATPQLEIVGQFPFESIYKE